ncbi:hypothetical protein [Granulicatella seriolae]|uniref:Uncharacterized protein n=1 Tax=Granulicatella seriolae TaxID=2967226 RepID=A0ABT1WP07_9LACT|nr:hypothetical protein [Granulicatella seriolae]
MEGYMTDKQFNEVLSTILVILENSETVDEAIEKIETQFMK